MHLVSSACADILETTFAGASSDLMKRIVSQKANKKPGAYTAELRSFVMTLKFYSAKAYKYVRNTFDLGHPHPSTIIIIQYLYSARSIKIALRRFTNIPKNKCVKNT